jgi:hypothetical protein
MSDNISLTAIMSLPACNGARIHLVVLERKLQYEKEWEVWLKVSKENLTTHATEQEFWLPWTELYKEYHDTYERLGDALKQRYGFNFMCDGKVLLHVPRRNVKKFREMLKLVYQKMQFRTL